MEFSVKTNFVVGIRESIIAAGNAMRVEMEDKSRPISEQDLKRGKVLGKNAPGTGHANFLHGIIVNFELFAPLYMWKEIQRYHFLEFVSSQSTMHRLTKFDIKSQCVSDTDEVILNRYQELLDNYNNYIAQENYDKKQSKKMWRTLVASLPSGFVLGATMTTNYDQLRTIYNQRKGHKLKEWHKFNEWCESLPYFKQFAFGEDLDINLDEINNQYMWR
jgi:hypothetical protein